MPMKKNLHCIVFIFFIVGNTYSQVVDIESQRILNKEKGVYGFINFNVNYTQNTQTIWQVSNTSKLLLQFKRQSVLLFGDFGLVRSSNAQDLINRGFGHIRYNYKITQNNRLTFEAFEQIQYNRIQKIDQRNLVGTGLRWRVLKTDTIDFFVGSSIMYEYEVVSNEAIPNQDARLSAYISFDLPIGNTVTINNIGYFQPLANQFSDMRISSQTTIKFNINKYLTFRVLFNYLLDTNPPQGIPNQIINIENGLELKF